jgi:hypothetical protein
MWLAGRNWPLSQNEYIKSKKLSNKTIAPIYIFQLIYILFWVMNPPMLSKGTKGQKTKLKRRKDDSKGKAMRSSDRSILLN